MPRMSNDLEEKREALENAMARLGGARRHLELVALRISHARKQQEALLGPAHEDLTEAINKIKRAQSELSDIWSKNLWKN
jgi:predicted  nucleic acid-binding Zn-ribbon protein